MRLLKDCQLRVPGSNQRLAPLLIALLIFLGQVLGQTSLLFAKKTKSVSFEEKIERILASSGLTKAQLSLQIVSIPDEKIIFEKNPDLALNPASNMKLVTAATALKELGPDFTFKTEFYSEGPVDGQGRLKNLWIKGKGDPLFVTEELDAIAEYFRGMGLQKIEGSIFVDDTYFDPYNTMTYLSDNNDKVYNIVTSPLSFNFNTISIKARPSARLGDQPSIALDSPVQYLTLSNNAKTVARGSRTHLDIAQQDDGQIAVIGSIPRTRRYYNFRKGVLDPANYTGIAIIEALQKKGIEVERGIKKEPVPPRASLLLIHNSPPLGEVLKGLGKHSNNFMAEQLLKTLGAVRYGAPGSMDKGIKTLHDYMASLGIPEEEYTIANGSGLSRLSRLSSRHLVKVLLDMYHSPRRDDLISSLSIAGIDGTIKSKMRRSPLAGKVFAKTGTLNGVKSLSGYLMDGEQKIAFSFLFNDFKVPVGRVARAEEAMLKAVWETY